MAPGPITDHRFSHLRINYDQPAINPRPFVRFFRPILFISFLFFAKQVHFISGTWFVPHIILYFFLAVRARLCPACQCTLLKTRLA